jgi:tetratricopeptide (TPR) repeat protein
MDKLINLIKDYAYDTENSEKNYQLALFYDSIDQTASAIAYYHRAAERTTDKLLAYECLLKCADCYERQGNRRHTVFVLVKHAMCVLPKRPEAFYNFSRLMRIYNEHIDAYTFAQIALETCDFDCIPLRSNVGYPGRWGFIFEKAVSAWYWGKGIEARKLLLELRDNHWDSMDQPHKQAVENNLKQLGSGPDNLTYTYYNKSNYDKLKFKFKGSENIEQNFSQAYQDMFVLTALDGKNNGTYLEIGSAMPFYGNNTALLENLGWTGIGIDIKQELVDDYSIQRKNKVLCLNALETNYENLISEIAVDGVIDYLQLDCEPSKTTFEVLLSIPFDTYKFAVITYEHDHYSDMTKTYRKKSRAFLKSLGYVLVVPNVSPNECSPFEDWWVHPDLIDSNILEKIKIEDSDITPINNYMLLK